MKIYQKSLPIKRVVIIISNQYNKTILIILQVNFIKQTDNSKKTIEKLFEETISM